MKLGLYTDSLGGYSFEEMLDIAASLKLECLEIAAGNWSGAPHLNLNEMLESSDARSAYMESIEKRGLKLTALNCSGNHLEPSEEGRRQEEVVHKTFELAGLLGVKKIVMMSGLPGGGPDSKYPVWVVNTWPPVFAEMLEYQWKEAAIPWWKEAVKRAADHGIEKIAIENHPNTLVFNVSTMCRLREAVGDMVGMNLDPSHTFFMGGDPIIMAKHLAAGGMVYHVHGKDTRIEADAAAYETLMEFGVGTPRNRRPWNYAAVGYGHDRLWWKRFLAALKMNGYNGEICLESGDFLMRGTEAVRRSAELLTDILL